MPSHAPLCGINRPHARHWSRTNRIDPILELPPVTSDTVTVPPPTRSPEPKVTRYLVIRNDQHGGSPHHGKIFIVAGNRLAAVHLAGKATITFRNHLAHPAPAAGVPLPPAGPARRIFTLGPTGMPDAPRRASPIRMALSAISVAGQPAETLRRASADGAWPAHQRSHHPRTASPGPSSLPGSSRRPGPSRLPSPFPGSCHLPWPAFPAASPARLPGRFPGRGYAPGYFPSYEHARQHPGVNDREGFFPDVNSESYKCTKPSRSLNKSRNIPGEGIHPQSSQGPHTGLSVSEPFAGLCPPRPGSDVSIAQGSNPERAVVTLRAPLRQ